MNDQSTRVCPYPFGPAEALDLHPRYAHLRSHEPISRVLLPFGGPAWLVTRYEDVRLVLGDPRFSRAAAVGRDVPRTRPARPRATSIIAMDPPEHTRVRRLIAKAFTVRKAERWRAHTTEIAEGLARGMADRGSPGDLVGDFAVPLPMEVLLAVMGIAHEDRAALAAAAGVLVSATAHTEAENHQARKDLAGLITAEIRRRRSHRADDLLGDLVAARDSEGGLSEPELIDLAVTLLAVGWETTACEIANFTYTLLTHPHLLDGLRGSRSRIEAAVEELLRYVPLSTAAELARIATEDTEVAGTLIRRGEAVLLAMHSANRDSRAFARPEDVDFTPRGTRHLAFGHGPHRCVGAELARMELQVALGTLLARFPGLALAVPARDVPWRAGSTLRAPSSLLVRW
ncbi:cytochrome P450 [Micromonospora sp. NPDC048830]|uniref:cytochrome P450 n=1 Tax=Micromonospora sp. NPDC048830 TaxID=3364257 RepID=UPI00371576A8